MQASEDSGNSTVAIGNKDWKQTNLYSSQETYATEPKRTTLVVNGILVGHTMRTLSL